MIKPIDAVQFNRGFTLIELIYVLAIFAIMSAIAIPSYQSYTRGAVMATAQQEMQLIAAQLERHKARNFTYKGFNANYLYTGLGNFNSTDQTLKLPKDASASDVKYTLQIVDGSSSNPALNANSALGQSWAIRAVGVDSEYKSLLLTSTGLRCKNTSSSLVSYTGCGSTGSESW